MVKDQPVYLVWMTYLYIYEWHIYISMNAKESESHTLQAWGTMVGELSQTFDNICLAVQLGIVAC